jgi:hypothetical protein
MNMTMLDLKDLENKVPEGFIRFECKLMAIYFMQPKPMITLMVNIYDKVILVPGFKVNIGYQPGAKCNCYKNKLSIDLPEELATERRLHPLGLENLEYL